MKTSVSIFKDTKKLVLISILVALGALFMLIEIPYPLVPFLKFDLSELVVLLTAELFGFIPAVIVSVFKILVHVSINGITTPYAIGQITSVIAAITIAALYLITKKVIKPKTVKAIFLRSFIVMIGFSIILTICNYLFITPVYFGEFWYTNLKDTLTLSNFIPWATADIGYGAIIAVVYLPFNAIKGVFILTIYELINKRINKSINI